MNRKPGTLPPRTTERPVGPIGCSGPARRKDETTRTPRRALRAVNTLVALATVAIASHLGIADPKTSRAATIAGAALVLWLTEAIPLYATTLLLWAGIALALGPIDPRTFGLPRVLAAANNPVVVLCFAGFVLSAAGTRYGIDAYVARTVVRAAGGRRRVLLLAVMVATATLSMWMLNIAAAAMMVATLRPLFDGQANDRRFRAALLVGLAFAANFGGIATPVGTGPNLVAIGAVGPRHPITFAGWMLMAGPVAATMLVLTYGLLVVLYRVRGSVEVVDVPPGSLGRRGWCVVALFFATVAAWLSEPVLGVPSAVTAMVMVATLFATGLLGRADLHAVGWDTLLLIAGGLTLGQLVEDAGLARSTAASVRWDALPPAVLIFGLVTVCALISAVASNTAAAAILIQVAAGADPSASTTILVALGASMGVPLVISTPPNAMVYGEGGLRPRDLMLPGTLLMLVGCLLLTVAGPALLRWAGVP